MNSLWQINFDGYFEIVKRSKEAGLKPGDDMTPIFLKYMEEKGNKPIGNTDMDIDLLAGNLRENGLKILNMKEFKNE